jgi:hypothetical protein
MTRPRSRSSRLVILLILAGVLSGCATSMGWSPHFGVRPDEPAIKTKADACDEYTAYSAYAQQLQEAYHSRATQNRGWIYVAGILGLGVMAASGGLAAATAVGAGTLGLLSISGGFAAGSFYTINNTELALSYTAAANSVDQALKDSRRQLTFEASGTGCPAALSVLIAGVSDARTHLEVSRTNNAAGALARAKDQQKILNDLIATVKAGDPTHVTLDAEIIKVEPSKPPTPNVETAVTITVKSIKLDQVALGDVKVMFGSKDLSADAIAQPDPANDTYTYTVRFKAPASPPDNKLTYSPALLIQGKTRVDSKKPGATGVTFTYP